MPTAKTVLALDVGTKRVGLAIASLETRLAQPLTTLEQSEDFWTKLEAIIDREAVAQLVLGLPRNLSGQPTKQTQTVEQFASQLTDRFKLPVAWQDEALTSQQAEAELQTRRRPYEKQEIDALAATYILNDWLTEQRNKRHAQV